MRATQLYGLTDEAFEFLYEKCIKEPASHCPHCNGPIGTKIKSEKYKDESNLGMFEDGPMLSKYFLEDGSVVKEVVQHTVWSSGPCIYLCLQDENGNNIFEWSEHDMEQ